MRRFSRWIPAISVVSIIWWSSSQPGSNLPPNDFNSLAHFLVYAVLAVAIHFALSRDHDAPTVWIFAILLASAYGVVDEVHQSFVPGRTPDIVDWGWDTLGAAVGASVASRVSGQRLHQPKRSTQTISSG